MKNNIWYIFYAMFFGAIILAIILLFSQYRNIKSRHHIETHHYTEIIAKAVNTEFLQNEFILDIIGKQLFEHDRYKDTAKTKQIIDELVEQNPNMIVFGLANANGKIIVSSSNVKNIEKKNLLKDEKTKYDFKKSLTSENMVIGRTYFFKAINEWIIPLRKVIKDKDGNTLGVAVAGLKNSKNFNYLDDLKFSKDKKVLIIKDKQGENSYRLYLSNSKNLTNEEIYNIPISKEEYAKVLEAINKKYNYTMEELRNSKETITIEHTSYDGEDVISGIMYKKRYNLWVVIQTNYEQVLKEFYKILFVYIFLFVISFIVFYILFRYIANSEKIKKDELVFQAEHDALTSLPNRTYMYNNIDRWKSEHIEQYDVLYIDLDNFKNINDKFGHSIGDKILVEVANRLKSFFKEDDMLIRQGGDEFIVLKECLDEKNIEKNLLELINLVSQTYYVQNKEFRVGMSVGIAKYPKDAKTIEELLSLADTAMYEAKKRKNSYCFFSEKMRYKNIMNTDIEQELRGAIENNELWMVYQPQINADGSLYGVEALVRWSNKKLGFVGPDIFITVAEETGLMRELGEFIISSSLKDIHRIKDELNIDFSLSINISVIQLIEADFLENFLKLVEKHGCDKTKITLEITESLSIEDLDEVLPLLWALRDEGIEISLDDFGTGYSSLGVLRDLPINELKIDKSFIDKILYDERESALVQSIINIGKNFGMKTLAEGVESLSQVELLIECKCDIFQGYYFSKPLNKDDLTSYINKECKDD